MSQRSAGSCTRCTHSNAFPDNTAYPPRFENLTESLYYIFSGTGCALDAATRGLKTALVEADDFSSGTSSRSTKLIHGGVRYLQKAIMGFDYEQYCMVKEALHERGNLLDIAPHLSFPLPIMLPVYK